MMREREAVALLARIFARREGVEVGIGDDAAVLEGGLVWTVDAQVEGVHFRPAWLSWQDVGWRSFMAAASDLAAMGAKPIAALSALVLAESIDDASLEALARGQALAAEALGTQVAGGNLARGGETSITTTLLGRAAKPILRSGAKPGDGLWLAGRVGLAGAGLVALAQNMQHTHEPIEMTVSPSWSPRSVHLGLEDVRLAPALAAWRRPVARIADGLAMAAFASAAIDVSDGLALDADRLAEASGVRLLIDARAIASAELDAAADAVSTSAVELALGGGEDYAILAASAAPLPGFVRIGEVLAADGGPRLVLDEGGSRRAIASAGFDHFAR
ncbi:MAG TPA: thiamine-phosphate kinase [Labilithrix sp.]